MDVKLPTLAVHPDYIMSLSRKSFGRCSLINFEKGECYKGVKFIDRAGQEWLIKEVRNEGNVSFFQRLLYSGKIIKIGFSLSKGKLYNLEELKTLISQFLLKNRLQGSSFSNKKKEVPEYLSEFASVHNLVEGLGYFDARK